MNLLETVRAPGGPATEVSQYLTFTLGEEEYGVEILKVQEIRGFSPITPMPNVPAFVKGVMNLRGTIIPVIDLRARFGLPPLEYNRFNVIMVVMVGTRVMGMVVDTVSDVLSLGAGDIQDPPDFGERVGNRAVNGLAKAGDKVILLLDIERVLGLEAAVEKHGGVESVQFIAADFRVGEATRLEANPAALTGPCLAESSEQR